MFGGDPRPKLVHLPLLLSFALFAVGSLMVIVANWFNSAFRVGENVVILSVVGLVILTAVLEFA